MPTHRRPFRAACITLVHREQFAISMQQYHRTEYRPCRVMMLKVAFKSVLIPISPEMKDQIQLFGDATVNVFQSLKWCSGDYRLPCVQKSKYLPSSSSPSPLRPGNNNNECFCNCFSRDVVSATAFIAVAFLDILCNMRRTEVRRKLRAGTNDLTVEQV